MCRMARCTGAKSSGALVHNSVRCTVHVCVLLYVSNLFVKLFFLGLIKVFGLVACVKVVSLVKPMEKNGIHEIESIVVCHLYFC